MTKKQTKIIQRHTASDLYYLHQCYDRPSCNKQNAYDNCKAKCSTLKGYDFKIIGYNSQMFSIGFYYVKKGDVMFHYETNKTSIDFLVEKSEKHDLQTKFEKVYKGCTLYAIHLDGFSHDVFYKDAKGTRHVDKYSAYLSTIEYGNEQEHVNRNGDKVYTRWNSENSINLFSGYAHSFYKHNAKEYVYIDIKRW